MPAVYTQEFRDDVVHIARNREPGQKLSQIAKDFGISESCLTNWTRQADVEGGNRPGKTREDSAELRELRRRNRLLEQENEVLRHAGRMRHLGLGRANKGTRVRLLIHGDDVLVASLDSGEVLGEFTIDPTRGYQARKKGPGGNQGPSS